MWLKLSSPLSLGWNFKGAEDVLRPTFAWMRLYNQHWIIERHGH